eukprot:1148082-Pelagomonas_calceolata.AAC.3
MLPSQLRSQKSCWGCPCDASSAAMCFELIHLMSMKPRTRETQHDAVNFAPELTNSGEMEAFATEALRITAPELVNFGVMDAIVPEPLGGAHSDPVLAFPYIKEALMNTYKEFANMSENQIKLDRYAKFRALGQFREYVVKGGDWKRTGEERDAVHNYTGETCPRALQGERTSLVQAHVLMPVHSLKHTSFQLCSRSRSRSPYLWHCECVLVPATSQAHVLMAAVLHMSAAMLVVVSY